MDEFFNGGQIFRISKTNNQTALQPYRIKQENYNNGIGIQKLILDLTGRESINQINI